jgi:ERCC4-type nuclease
MPSKRRLIKSPLEFPGGPPLAPPPLIPVLAQRGGTQIQTPKAVVLVDTREQIPFRFSRFRGWFAGVKEKALKVGDYSIEGMEDQCVVERKELADLMHSFTTDRAVFVARLKQMARREHRLLVITAPLSHIKSGYGNGGSANRATQSLMAALVGWHVPFLCTETHELGEEIVASYLYQVHLYHWLETNGYDRCLADGDL